LDEFRGYEVLVGECVAKKKNGFFSNPKSLLMLDSCTAHITPEIKTIVNKYSKIAVIPGGLTKKLQPLDITVNKPFKDQLRVKWENWIMGGIHEYNKTGQMKRPSYKDIVAWSVESWATVNKNCVRNGVIKARGDEAVSGDSDYVHDDTFSEMEAVSGDSDCVHDDTVSEMEAEEIPKEILNAIDSFSIESDEEFLGFE
jgi:hypothetical protein